MYSRTKPVGAQSSSSEYHRYNTNDYTTRQEEQTQAWLSPASHHTSRQVATTTIATADTRIETWPNGDESGAEDSFVAASYTSSVRDSVGEADASVAVDTASDIDISLSFGHNSSYNTDSFNIGNYSVVDNNYTVNSRGSFGQLLKSDAPSTIALSRESSVETLRGIIANKEHEACDTPDHWSSSPSPVHHHHHLKQSTLRDCNDQDSHGTPPIPSQMPLVSRGASSGSVGFTSPLEKTRAAGLATSSTPWSPSTASTAGTFYTAQSTRPSQHHMNGSQYSPTNSHQYHSPIVAASYETTESNSTNHHSHNYSKQQLQNSSTQSAVPVSSGKSNHHGSVKSRSLSRTIRTSDIVMAMNGTQATTYQNTRSPPLDAQPSSFNYKMTNDHHQHPQSQKAIDSIAVEYATMYSAPSDQLHGQPDSLHDARSMSTYHGEEQPLNRGNLHTEARVERATSPTPSPKSWHAHEYSRDDYNAVEMTTPHTPRHMEFNESNNPRASRRLTQMFQYAVGDEMRAKRMSLAAQNAANTVIRDGKGRYRPLFMASIIAIQIVILLVEMAVNYQLTGSFIQTGNAFNYLIGPGSLAWIRSGARFTACMRSTTLDNASILLPGMSEAMSLSDICGFGGFPSGTPDQWYRLIIPIFLHGGLLHLLFNGVFQWRTGMQMEREWGAIRLAPIYLLGGIGGFLLGAVVAPVQMISLGASGSVFALLAASMIDLLQHWNETAGRGRQMAELVVIIVLSFVIGLLPGIDNFAHIGGFLFGIFTSLVFLPPTAGRFWKVSRWIGGAIVITLYVVLFVVFYTEADPQSTCPWCKYLSCLPINGWCDAFDNNNNNPSRSSM